MRKLLLLSLLALLPLRPAHAAQLKVGDPAPDFQAIDDQGKTVSLQDFRGKAVVLYFYPKDDSPGCRFEAESFRDHHSEFQNLNTVVLGVSYDSQESHKRFKEKYRLSFPLLVDKDHKIAKAYGAAGEVLASRDVIVIDHKGKVSKILRSVNPETVVSILLKDAE